MTPSRRVLPSTGVYCNNSRAALVDPCHPTLPVRPPRRDIRGKYSPPSVDQVQTVRHRLQPTQTDGFLCHRRPCLLKPQTLNPFSSILSLSAALKQIFSLANNSLFCSCCTSVLYEFVRFVSYYMSMSVILRIMQFSLSRQSPRKFGDVFSFFT